MPSSGGSSGGSTPALAAVLAAGGDPNNYPITGNLDLNPGSGPIVFSLGSDTGFSTVISTLNGLSVVNALYAGRFGFIFQFTAAPADGDLDPGQCAFWLDATPGATKLMVKAKDSGGTLRSTAISLT